MTGREFVLKQLDITANQMTYKNEVFDVLFFLNSPLDGVCVRASYFESLSDADEYAQSLSDLYDSKYPDIAYVSYVFGRCKTSHNIGTLCEARANEQNLIIKK